MKHVSAVVVTKGSWFWRHLSWACGVVPTELEVQYSAVGEREQSLTGKSQEERAAQH